MKVWIHINGVQEGPFEETHLPLDRMNVDTPVWYQGLPDWLPAGRAKLTAPYFFGQKGKAVDRDTDAALRAYETLEGRKVEPKQTASKPGTGTAGTQAQFTASTATPAVKAAAASATAVVAETPAKRPASYIIFSAFLAIITFNIFTILAVIAGVVVIMKNKNGNYATAAKFSEFAAWMLMIGMVFILMSPFLSMIAL